MTAQPLAPRALAPVPASAPLSATVPVADLRRAVTFARQAISRRPPLHVLAGVLLSASRTGLRVEGYDYESHAAETISAPGVAGAALVHAGRFADMLSTIPKGCDVVLRSNGTHLTIVAEHVTFGLPLMTLADYPTLPGRGERLMTLPGAALDLTASVAVAAGGRRDTIPQLQTVQWTAPEGTLTAAATDRYRLAFLDTALPAPVGLELLLPARPLARVAAAMRAEQTVQVHRNDTVRHSASKGDVPWVTFTGTHRTVAMHTTGGEYPKWRPLVDVQPNGTLTADRDSLAAAVRQAAVAVNGLPVLLGLSPTGPVTVEAGDLAPDSPYAAPTVPGASWTGADLAFRFDPRYMTQGLAALAPGDVTVAVTGPTRPVLLSSVDDPAGVRYLLMPVRPARG